MTEPPITESIAELGKQGSGIWAVGVLVGIRIRLGTVVGQAVEARAH